MDIVERLVREARRRLIIGDLLVTIPRCLTAYLALAAIAISISKLLPLGVDQLGWTCGWIIAAILATIGHACLRVIRYSPSSLSSAVEVDRRYQLRERLSSAWSIGSSPDASPLTQALLADASSKAATIDLRDHFPLLLPRTSLWLTIPLLALLALWFVPDAQNAATQVAQTEAKATATQVKNSTEPLLEQLRKKRLDAEEKGLTEVADLFRQLESELEKMQREGKLEKAEVLSKLNELKERIQERRQEVGSAENLQKNLENLKDLNDGPAEELAKSIEQGDLEAAKNEVDKLRQQLEKNELSEEDKQKLTEQLKQMESALREAAENQDKARQELEKKIQAAQQAGDMQQAADAQKQLEQLEANAAQMDKMRDIAQQLADTQNALQQGDAQKAADKLQELSDEFQEMSEQMKEESQLDEMMQELEQSKDKMNCQQCQGKGCENCKSGQPSSSGQSSNKSGTGKSDSGGKTAGRDPKGKGGKSEGFGVGEGQGAGERPESEDQTDTIDSQIRDKIRKGETTFGGRVGGANRKGVSREEVKASIESEQLDNAEALDSEVLPKSRQEQTRDYFKTLRDGKRAD